MLARAGAITVTELAAAGVPSILVPLVVSTTHHQRTNAEFMAAKNAAIHLPQGEATAERLAGCSPASTARACRRWPKRRAPWASRRRPKPWRP